MGMGPITIYDKSALQSLSMDESVWLDAFFLVNMVPMFYVETLADLDKVVRPGTSAEDLVGMLAHKTPSRAFPNLHHLAIIDRELHGTTISMNGRVIGRAGERRQTADGRIGLHIEEFDETVALDRWRNHHFLDIERDFARRWRDDLVDSDRDRTTGVLRNVLPSTTRCSNIFELKQAIDEFCTVVSAETVALAAQLLGFAGVTAEILDRWNDDGKRMLSDFAPYMTHVFKVELLYYLGIDRGFISGERASNKVDMAYLYYLPFCMVFASGDKLHRRVAPLFLRPDQSYVEAADLKAALNELDQHFDRLPSEVKALGVMGFAHQPPLELDNLVVRLWDKHLLPIWREQAQTPEQILAGRQTRNASTEQARALREAAQGAVPSTPDEASSGDPSYVVIERRIPRQKGKWTLVPGGEAAMPNHPS